MHIPYFLCEKIIEKSKGNSLTHNDVIETLSFHNDAIYQKTNRVPISEYFDLIYNAERHNYNILDIYNNKGDILYNYSNMLPQFGLVCLNKVNLLSAITSFISLITKETTDAFEVINHSIDDIEIVINPPCEKLNNSIYLPLGNMLVIRELVKYYLPEFMDDNITMNFIGGSQQHYEREVTKNLHCNVNFKTVKTSIRIITPHFKTPFEGYNKHLHNIEEKCEFKSFVFESNETNQHMELIEEISSIIKYFHRNANSNKKCPIKYISTSMNIPVWTLQRRLLMINKTYKGILNNTLIEIATNHLYEGEKSIRDISEILGFSSQAGFTRFFKLMTGVTPLAYKKRHNNYINMSGNQINQ